jgi:hypothetical protein
MTDPHRLSSNLSDADDLERELLASIRQLTPPAGAKSEAWEKLSVQIAAVGLVSVASVQGTTAAPAAWSSAALKGLLGKVLLGVAVAGTGSALWLHAQGEPPTAHVAASAVAVAVSPPPATTAPVEPTSEIAPIVPTAAPAPVDIPIKPSSAASREDRLIAESKLLTLARAELRRGNAASAQQLLEQMRVKFPNAVLGQEREVLNIEVLAARGNTDAARRRARAFIAAYPKSPHSAQLARFADGP